MPIYTYPKPIVDGDIEVDNLQFKGGTGTQGTMSWNSDEETVDLIQDGTTLQLGQELHYHVRNDSGGPLTSGDVVYASGTLGASGRILVDKFIADGSILARYILGVITEDIADGEDGKATKFGKVRGIDTSIYTEGTVLYASETTAGAVTDIEPTGGTNQSIPLAFTVNSKNNGTWFVRVTPIDENALGGGGGGGATTLSSLTDVVVTTVADNEVLAYDSTSGDWINQTASEAGLATSAQGTLADSAVQPGDNVSDLTNDSGYLTTVAFGDLTSTPTTLTGYGITDSATSAQGALADSATQPGDNISTLTNDSGYITGNETITLSGDITGSGTTAITASIASNSVGITELDVTDGTNGQVLSTDGSGNLSFTTVSFSGDPVIPILKLKGTSTSSISNTEVDVTWSTDISGSFASASGADITFSSTGVYAISVVARQDGTGRTETIVRTYLDTGSGYSELTDEIASNYTSRDTDQDTGGTILTTALELNSGDILKFTAECDADNASSLLTAGTRAIITKIG